MDWSLAIFICSGTAVYSSGAPGPYTIDDHCVDYYSLLKKLPILKLMLLTLITASLTCINRRKGSDPFVAFSNGSQFNII